MQTFESNSDSLLLNTDDTQPLIDTLTKINEKLQTIETDMRSQEAILGNMGDEILKVSKSIQYAEQKVAEVKKYNKTILRKDSTINNEVQLKSVSKKLMIDKTMKVQHGEYITFSFDIINHEIMDEIYAIQVSITDATEHGDTVLFSQNYEPHVGENKFIVKNFFKEAKNAKFDVGFIYKEEVNVIQPVGREAPVATICGGLASGTYTKEQLSKNQFFEVTGSGLEWKLASYFYTYTVNGIESPLHSVPGKDFPTILKQKIAQAKEGTIFRFKNI